MVVDDRDRGGAAASIALRPTQRHAERRSVMSCWKALGRAVAAASASARASGAAVCRPRVHGRGSDAAASVTPATAPGV
eukprot:scaffold3032_cov375-Prasinococcus_capsulatus_cf.AAC.21